MTWRSTISKKSGILKNFRQDFEILTLLLGGATCLGSLVKILRMLWYEGVTFQRNVEFFLKFWNSSFATGLYYMFKNLEWSNRNWRRSSDLK